MGITAEQIDRLGQLEAERKELRKALISELAHQLRVIGYRPSPHVMRSEIETAKRKVFQGYGSELSTERLFELYVHLAES